MHKLGTSSTSSLAPVARHGLRNVYTGRDPHPPKQTPRQGRRGWLYGVEHEQPDITPEENIRITRRRIAKAERDERIDITAALTPVKTYMDGFTRPRDLRSSNWWPGGRYRDINKVYEKPVTSAYEPYTVFILESRYPIVHGIGRVDAHEHLVGVCREADLPGIIELYNSGPDGPGNEGGIMDKARWPWTKQKHVRAARWWNPGEDPTKVRQTVLEDIDAPPGEKQVLYFGGDRETQADVRLEQRETLDGAPHIGVKPKEVLGEEQSGIHAEETEQAFEQRLSEREMQRRERAVAAKNEILGTSTNDGSESSISKSTYADMNTPSSIGFPKTTTSGDIHSIRDPNVVSSTPLKTPGAIEPASSSPSSTPTNSRLEVSISDSDPDENPHVSSLAVLNQVTQAEADAAAQQHEQLLQLRSEYTPTLADTPFWRLLITATFSTRPLAMSVARLSKSLSRGLPYHASMSSHDRKARLSFSGRMRGMRLSRLTDLVVDAVQLLDGWRGGFVGMRFSPDDVGRGINGEHLAKGVPFAKRLVKIGVGEWYPLAQETLNIFHDAATKPPYTLTRGPAGESPLELFKLDERGYRLDAEGQRVPYPEQVRAPEDTEMQGILDAWLGEALDEEVDEALEDAPERNFNLDKQEMERRVRQRVLDRRRQELSRGDPNRIAHALAERGPKKGFVQLPRKVQRKQLLEVPLVDVPPTTGSLREPSV